MSKLTRTLLVIGGTLLVGLGVIGIFLPILPTTPFLLLAAFLYARSSERFLHWLLTNRWFGAYIKNYREGNGIPLREKILTISLLWATILYSILCLGIDTWIKVLLAVIAICVSIHLVRIKTFKAKPKSLTKGIKPAPEESSGES